MQQIAAKTVGALVVAACCLSALSQLARGQSPYPTTDGPSTQWGGYTVSDPVPYQPSLEPSCESSTQLPPAVPPGSEPWQIYPVTPPPNTPIVTIPAPGAVEFPQAGVSPSGMKPWFPPGGRQTFFQKVKFTARLPAAI